MTVMNRTVAAVCGALLVVAGAAACSSSKKTFTYCTDPNYPPAEFHQVGKVGTAELKRQLVGADIDIAHDVAKRIDRSVRYTETSFTGIIPALLDKRCDAIISFMNDTPERRKQVAFVDYLAAGQSVMIDKNAAPVNTVADLYGRTVSVARETTEEAFLNAQNKAAPAGQSISIKSYDTENDAIYALQQHTAQVYFGDTPIVESAVAADKSLAQGAELVKPTPIGIALRPGDPRIGKVTAAVRDSYDDGTMGRILAKWKFTRYAITP
jgi:ABC-type amino acid transport substrate-binding protein